MIKKAAKTTHFVPLTKQCNNYTLPIDIKTAALPTAATEPTRNAIFISLEYCQINKEGKQWLFVIHQTAWESQIFSQATYKTPLGFL